MNVAYFGYRSWAKKIQENLESYSLEFITDWKITDISESDVALYYGWSWLIPKEIYSNKLCLILHPSPLPKYRGGSPLQHQIMSGEKMSAVTICKATNRLDSGDIYSQTPFSLDGTLDEIFMKIIDIGTSDTIKVLNQIAKNQAKPIPQDETGVTSYKRRQPSESELTLDRLKTMSAKEIYNFVRSLAHPYPNAYIKCSDGKRLYLTEVHL